MKNTRNRYDWQAMLIITILMIISIFLISIPIIYQEINGIILIVIGIFFLAVGIYCWFLYICNVIIKPKKEILYLLKKEKNINEFIDVKGRIYYYNSKKEYELQRFYSVLKTRNDIKKVIELSSKTFEISRKKESYWLSFYSPIGNFENIFLLPIIYLIDLIGLLTLITTKILNLSSIIMIIFSTYLIIYDLVYKNKRKKKENLNEEKLIKSFAFLIIGIKIFSALVICGILIYIFFLIDNNIIRLFFLPFLMCGLSLLGELLANTFNKQQLSHIFKKTYILSFLSYWFLILIIGCFISIKDKNYISLLFTIPFWLVGIWLIKKYVLNKK